MSPEQTFPTKGMAHHCLSLRLDELEGRTLYSSKEFKFGDLILQDNPLLTWDTELYFSPKKHEHCLSSLGINLYSQFSQTFLSFPLTGGKALEKLLAVFRFTD
jgi:hypothetical protein